MMEITEEYYQQCKAKFKQHLAKAKEGDAEAQCGLGECFFTGGGVTQDYKEAVKWIRKAADQEHAYAQSFLGMMYDLGLGVLTDDQEAVKWYCKAAYQGDVDAQFNLGIRYHQGQGAPKDDVAAYAWYNVSAFNGDDEGPGERDEIAKEMTQEQIAEAQELSKALLNQIEENKKKAK